MYPEKGNTNDEVNTRFTHPKVFNIRMNAFTWFICHPNAFVIETWKVNANDVDGNCIISLSTITNEETFVVA